MEGKVARYTAILGLTGRVSFDDVKSAYRREMLKWHPDFHHNKETASVAHARSVALNEAYEFLSEITEDGSIPDLESRTAWEYDQYRTRPAYQKQSFRPGFSDPAVLEVFVKSSMIISAGYNAAESILYLKFQNGSVYRYFNVPGSIFNNFLGAESQGKYANRNILRSFRYELY